MVAQPLESNTWADGLSEGEQEQVREAVERMARGNEAVQARLLDAIGRAGAYLVGQKGLRPLSARQRVVAGFVLVGRGHGLVDAVAGSGKTSTLVQVATLLQLLERDGVFLAFNKKVADDAKTKLAGTPVEAATLNAWGNRAICAAYPSRPQLKESKYRDLARAHLERNAAALGLLTEGRPDRERIKEAARTADKMVRLLRDTLTPADDPDALRAMCKKYDIDLLHFELVAPLLPGLLAQGRAMAPSVIDYADQLWLPVVDEHVGAAVPRKDVVLVDECQDLSATKLRLAKLACAPGGRMVFVGDPHQAIMGFAGADDESVEHIRADVQPTAMLLDLSYRCPQRHVDLVNRLYPEIPIHATADALPGTVRLVSREDMAARAQPGALLQSRTTADAVSMALACIRLGKRALVLGRDIGGKIKETVELIAEQPGFSYDAFPEYVTAYHARSIAGLDPEDDDDARLIQFVTDRVETVRVIYSGTDAGGDGMRGRPADLDALYARIDSLFAEPKAGERESIIWTCTIHKAKGAEARQTGIITGLYPHKMAKTPMAINQEHNLLYVALTRCTKGAAGELLIAGEVPAAADALIAAWGEVADLHAAAPAAGDGAAPLRDVRVALEEPAAPAAPSAAPGGPPAPVAPPAALGRAPGPTPRLDAAQGRARAGASPVTAALTAGLVDVIKAVGPLAPRDAEQVQRAVLGALSAATAAWASHSEKEVDLDTMPWDEGVCAHGIQIGGCPECDESPYVVG